MNKIESCVVQNANDKSLKTIDGVDGWSFRTGYMPNRLLVEKLPTYLYPEERMDWDLYNGVVWETIRWPISEFLVDVGDRTGRIPVTWKTEKEGDIRCSNVVGLFDSKKTCRALLPCSQACVYYFPSDWVIKTWLPDGWCSKHRIWRHIEEGDLKCRECVR